MAQAKIYPRWTKKQKEFARENAEKMPLGDLLVLLNKTFTTDFSIKGLKAVLKNRDRISPLGAERIQGGKVYIKCEENPSKWKKKNIFLYEQYHGVTLTKNDLVIFLDSDHNNYDVSNLYLLKRQFLILLNKIRNKNDTKETTLKKIELVKTQVNMLNLAEKAGLCRKSNSRVIRFVANEKRRNWRKNMPEEKKEKIKQKRKEDYKKRKEELKNDPEKEAEEKKKARERRKRYRERQRLLKKGPRGKEDRMIKQ